MGEDWKTRGKLLQEVNALRDRIAQLEQAEDSQQTNELNEVNAALGTVLDNIIEGVLLIDVMSRQFVACNKVGCEMLGCKKESIADLRIEDVHPTKEADHLIERIERLASEKSSHAQSMPVKNYDGTVLFKEVTFIPLTFADKKYILSVLRDASPEKTGQTRSPGDLNHSSKNSHLTATEINVLKLIANGMSNKDIARLLSRSPRTIENHRAHLMKKLDVDNSIELVRQAVALGLVELPEEPQSSHSI
jgi:PAS domain S-box-containing protein